jgi:hypothetical protein
VPSARRATLDTISTPGSLALESAIFQEATVATSNTPAVPQPIAAPAVVDSAGEGISRASILRLVAIVGAGAVGGFLFWILAKLTGTSPLPVSCGLWTIPCLMFLGAFAAAIGVYVLTASDTAAIKTYIFASLCGLCWQPIIASGVRMVANATAASQTAMLGSQVQAVQQAMDSSNKQQLTDAVQQTVPLVTQALNTTAATNTDNRTEVVDSSKQVVTQLQSAAATAPNATVEAIQKISVAAANANTPSVALHGVQTLLAIGLRASRAQDTAVMETVLQSLASIATESKDSSIQTAARNAAKLLQP